MNISVLPTIFLTSLVQGGGFDPGVSPNAGGIPGLAQLKTLVGGVMAAVVVLLVLAAIVSAVVWAVGSISGRAGMGSGGKTGVLISIIAAIVVGAASFLIKWAAGVGQQVKASDVVDAGHMLGQSLGWC